MKSIGLIGILILLISGCAQQSEITESPSIQSPVLEYEGVVLEAEIVNQSVTSRGIAIDARVTIKTGQPLTIQYLFFATDDWGDVIFSYPFPPREVEANTEREFTPSVVLDNNYALPGKYYFTTLVFDENETVIAAKDIPLDVKIEKRIKEVVIDCFNKPDDRDSNLCIFDLNVTGYIKIVRVSDNSWEPVTGPFNNTGYFTLGDERVDILFHHKTGEFITPDEEGEYSGSITVSAEGYRPRTKKFNFAVLNVSALRANCDQDGECGPFESFGTCPEDCLSGEYDRYCDKEADGKCDPDCLIDEDLDCK